MVGKNFSPTQTLALRGAEDAERVKNSDFFFRKGAKIDGFG